MAYYPPAVLNAGAKALCERAGVLGRYEDLEPNYRDDLKADAAAVLDSYFTAHLASERERRAAAVKDGFPPADTGWLMLKFER